jgi:protein tyrosine phosphatase
MHGAPLNDLLLLCKNIYETMNATEMIKKKLLIHCTAGVGRSALCLVAYRLYEAVQKLNKTGIPYCFDDGTPNEKKLFIENSVNLAYLLRTAIFQGRSARGIFIASKRQFKALWNFAKHLASPTVSSSE